MQYNPSYISCRSILSKEQKKHIHSLAAASPLAEFKKDSRNFEEASIDFIYTSARIEGNSYDRLDTSALLRMGITAEGKRYSDATMILNLRDAFNMVMQCDANTEINRSYVCDLHQELTKNGLLLPKEQGIIRTGHVEISGTSYTPLDDPVRLREEMNFTLLESNKYDDPFERAIYLHCNIAYLQYFSDGNKRLARMVQTATLTQLNLMPLLFDIRFARQYINSVIDYYESGDYQPYVDFFQKNYELSTKRMLGMSFEEIFGAEVA